MAQFLYKKESLEHIRERISLFDFKKLTSCIIKNNWKIKKNDFDFPTFIFKKYFLKRSKRSLIVGLCWTAEDLLVQITQKISSLRCSIMFYLQRFQYVLFLNFGATYVKYKNIKCNLTLTVHNTFNSQGSISSPPLSTYYIDAISSVNHKTSRNLKP